MQAPPDLAHLGCRRDPWFVSTRAPRAKRARPLVPRCVGLPLVTHDVPPCGPAGQQSATQRRPRLVGHCAHAERRRSPARAMHVASLGHVRSCLRVQRRHTTHFDIHVDHVRRIAAMPATAPLSVDFAASLGGTSESAERICRGQELMATTDYLRESSPSPDSIGTQRWGMIAPHAPILVISTRRSTARDACKIMAASSCKPCGARRNNAASMETALRTKPRFDHKDSSMCSKP